MPRIFQLLVREARIERAGQHHTCVLQCTHVSFRILFVLRVALQSHSHGGCHNVPQQIMAMTSAQGREAATLTTAGGALRPRRDVLYPV